MKAQGVVLRDIADGAAIRTKSQFQATAGQFVVSRIDARNGAFGIVPHELNQSVVSSNFLTFDIDKQRLEPQFLEFFAARRTFWEQCAAISEGTTNRVPVRLDGFLALKLPLPPLAEQRRIVARIQGFVDHVSQVRSLQDQAANEVATLTSSALESVFSPKPWPAAWGVRPLPEVADLARGKFGHRPRNEPRFYGGTTPFIQIGDISNSNRYIRSHSQTLNEAGLAISRSFPAGTVVIAITGATIGVTGILTFESCFPDSIVGIQAKAECTTPEFIYFAVEHAKKTALAEATQSTQPNINLGNLERLKVLIPPMSEQLRIVTYLEGLQEHIDALKRLQAERAEEMAALLPSLFDRAFTGQL